MGSAGCGPATRRFASESATSSSASCEKVTVHGSLQLFDELGEHEAERHAARVQVVIAESILDVHLVPQVNDRVAAQLGQLLVIGPFANRAFEPELRPESQNACRDA